MARDGLTQKVRPFLLVLRVVTSSAARPLFNQSCMSLSNARHMVSLLAAAPAASLSARWLRIQRPRLAVIEHPGRGEGGGAGRACAGHTDSGTGSGGCAQPGHLPHALFGPGSQPRTGLRRWLKTGSPWGWNGTGRRARAKAKRAVRLGGGVYWGTPEPSQATEARGVALWEGCSVRMATAVAWSASNSASRCQRQQRWGLCVGSGYSQEKT